MLEQIACTVSFDFRTGSLDFDIIAENVDGNHVEVVSASEESGTFTTKLEIFVLNHNGVVIYAPGVDYLLKNVYTLDTSNCVCGLESNQGCQYCLQCGHCCRGRCKDYTTYSPECCTSKAQFCFWLQNCTCMCTIGNCHHCKECRSCCQCDGDTIEREVLLIRCKMHLICQDVACSNRYLLSRKGCLCVV